jgi:glycosyltransferase involved in cell wall biosynthesis
VLAIWKGASESHVGGSVTHISGILGAVRATGFRVALLTSCPPPPQVRASVDYVEVVPVVGPGSRVSWDMERLTSNRLFRRAGLALGRRLRPAFVYQRHAFLMTAGVDVAKSLGVPLALEWNASEVWARANWERAGSLGSWNRASTQALGASIERRLLDEADVVAAVSDRAADQAREVGVSEDKLVVVPNGVRLADCPLPERQLGERQRTAETRPGARLGWIGSFGPWHGAEVLVRSLAHLPDDVEAVMVGDGIERPACMALAREEGVDQRVEWTGALAHPDALQRLATCDVLVSPHVPLRGTPFFGSPTKLFEYMALGKPIVASRLEQLEQVLEDGTTARLVEPGNHMALAAGIRSVLEAPDRGRSLGERAREVAGRDHTWDQRAGAILAVLRRTGTARGA